MNINYNQSENTSVIKFLKRNWDNTRPQNLSAPISVYDLYKNPLGTHPDLVDYFWNKLTVELPMSCGWVLYGNPVLVHPHTGIVFGFAGGTHTYALRLPKAQRQEAIEAGSKRAYTYSNGTQLFMDEIGEEWVLGGWFKREPHWCQAAFENAGKM